MTTEMIELKVLDGTMMNAFVAHPDNPDVRRAGILLFQEAFGVNGHIRDVAARFGREGYTVIAPELYHRTAPGWEGPYDKFEASRTHLRSITHEGLREDIEAAWKWLKDEQGCLENHISSVGFCFGGWVALYANLEFPLASSVSFYGGRIAGELARRPATPHAPVLTFWGGRDGHISPADVQAVSAALRKENKPHVNVEFSFAGHGFFNNERPAYHGAAASMSWWLTLSFLQDVLEMGIPR